MQMHNFYLSDERGYIVMQITMQLYIYANNVRT